MAATNTTTTSTATTTTTTTTTQPTVIESGRPHPFLPSYLLDSVEDGLGSSGSSEVAAGGGGERQAEKNVKVHFNSSFSVVKYRDIKASSRGSAGQRHPQPSSVHRPSYRSLDSLTESSPHPGTHLHYNHSSKQPVLAWSHGLTSPLKHSRRSVCFERWLTNSRLRVQLFLIGLRAVGVTCHPPELPVLVVPRLEHSPPSVVAPEEALEVQDRVMLAARHVVRDVSCKNCGAKLGWIYEFATEENQRTGLISHTILEG
ncbi:uncharacterized protein LOC126993374 isoform X2 [Eriocheir sinensis]|uniref:uncharacterized protein LOC126993374 isoform X2 n=1 Tax=Eriocheir sinensis TaxID=95602 RepID=UPI0021C7507B|nr:uncharacterized protein LOC126993374 isoform X2 [Eriocheir sinensis]